MAYKSTHTWYSLLCLASFTQCKVFEVHPCCRMSQYLTVSFFAVKYSIVWIHPILFLVIDSIKRGRESWQDFTPRIVWAGRQEKMYSYLFERTGVSIQYTFPKEKWCFFRVSCHALCASGPPPHSRLRLLDPHLLAQYCSTLRSYFQSWGWRINLRNIDSLFPKKHFDFTKANKRWPVKKPKRHSEIKYIRNALPSLSEDLKWSWVYDCLCSNSSKVFD